MSEICKDPSCPLHGPHYDDECPEKPADQKVIVVEGNDLNKLKDSLAKDLYGITPKQARERGLCIQCKQPALDRCYSEAGKKEYRISGLCELCFDEIMGG